MSGDYDSVIGMAKEGAVTRFWRKMSSERLAPAECEVTVSGAFVETDNAAGEGVEPVRVWGGCRGRCRGNENRERGCCTFSPPLRVTAILTDIGQDGVYDYQRRENHRTGFAHLHQYGYVPNFNVGLFCQQAGLLLEEALEAAGRYARIFSGNAKPDQPYGLDPQTAEFIESGYTVGQSGVFGSQAAQE